MDGYLTVSGKDGNAGYVQVLRNGTVESAAGGISTVTDCGQVLFAEEVEDHVARKVERYLNALRRVEVSPPFAVLLAGDRMHGIAIAPRQPAYYATLAGFSDVNVFFHPVIVEDYGSLDEYYQALKPVFDALWNAGGYPGSQSYGSEGKWRRQK